MRISDWSSDVCSSDLGHGENLALPPEISIGEARDVAHMDARADDPATLAHQLQGGGNKRTDWREDENGVEFHRCTLGRCAGPAAAERSRKGLGLRVLFAGEGIRSDEHTSELQSLMRTSYAVF